MGGMGEDQMMTRSPQEKDGGPVSVFLSKEALGGMTPKEGDRITLSVKSVDPETGDVEAVIEPTTETGEQSPSESAFDEAVPEE